MRAVKQNATIASESLNAPSFSVPMPEPTVSIGSPKGALMQTSFACGQAFAPGTTTRGVPAPSTLDQPSAGWMPGTFRGSITTKGGDPLPLTPSQPCADWMRGRACAPLHHAGGQGPLRPSKSSGRSAACPLYLVAPTVAMESGA